MKKKINIFGSCVTRDVFEFDKQRSFVVQEYFARQSLISILSHPFFYDDTKIELESLFQKKQIKSDMDKTSISILTNSAADYLLIDLIEERFDIVKVKESYMTFSGELQKSNVLSSCRMDIYKKKVFYDKVFFRGTDVSVYIERFVDRLLKTYRQEQIIIHEVYFSNFYLDSKRRIKKFSKSQVLYNKRINTILRYMYKYMRRILPNAKVICISGQYVADEKHKWGLAPMHYQKEYYKNVLEELLEYVKLGDGE